MSHVNLPRGRAPDLQKPIDIICARIIHLLNVLRINIAKPQCAEAFSTEIGIVTCIKERAPKIGIEGHLRAAKSIRDLSIVVSLPRYHVKEFAIDNGSISAATYRAAIDILIYRSTVH